MSVRVINLARYNTPDPVEKRGKQWVSYGESNDFYEELLRLKDSPTNSALINGITEMMYGRGLAATDGDKNPEGYANAMGLFKEDVLRCVMDDFYTLGQGFFQVIKNQSGSKIVQLEHIPTQYLRPEKCDEEGNIRGYYYHEDWPNLKPTEMPERIAAFGFGNGKEVEVLCISSYKSGHFYFSPVEYQSGLDYAAVEVEVANFHLNNIMNGFSSNMIINFNNGQPQEDEKDAIERKINDKFTGADNAGRVVIAFNDGAESAANIESVQLNNAHDQYQFLSDEAAKKLMVSHRVTSPILLGISHNTGLGNNADELRTASVLFDNTVIKPLQRHIIKALNEICEYNNYSFKWYFKTLQPLEYLDIEPEKVEEEEVEEKTAVEMSAEAVDLISKLGETEENLEGWTLIEEDDVDYDSDDIQNAIIKQVNDIEADYRKAGMFGKLRHFVSTGTARPNANSSWDQKDEELVVKVRYEYSPRKASPDSRDFCKRMVSAGKLYRREDIDQMSNKAVNPGWGPGGANTYDIFLWKGGGDCHHRWTRKIYARLNESGDIDVKSPRAQQLITSYRDVVSAGYDKGQDPDYNKAKTRPKDMTNRGFLKPRG